MAVAVAVAATLVWIAFTMVLLGSSDPPVPDARVIRHLDGVPLPILTHLFLFGVLGLLASISAVLVAHGKRAVLKLAMALLVGALWGTFTEWYQTTLPGRGGSLEDILIDVVGSAVGCSIVWLAQFWIAHRTVRVTYWSLHS